MVAFIKDELISLLSLRLYEVNQVAIMHKYRMFIIDKNGKRIKKLRFDAYHYNFFRKFKNKKKLDGSYTKSKFN